MDMREQCFGIEVEFTGITRNSAGKILAKYFGATMQKKSDFYDTHFIVDNLGRKWSVMYDGSIRTMKKENGETRYISDKRYSCEFVTPKCNYEDILKVQEIIRLFRESGATTNSSCGIHIHVDGANHNAKSLVSITNIMSSKEFLIVDALKVDRGRENSYCQKVDADFREKINAKKDITIEEIGEIWYSKYEGLHYGRTRHYSQSRYRALNLHSFYSKGDYLNGEYGTVEFRMFNSILHAGKIKAYLQFCLALSAYAINHKSKYKPLQTENKKFSMRAWLKQLDLVGEEFSTCRKHMMDLLEGNSQWKYGQEGRTRVFNPTNNRYTNITEYIANNNNHPVAENIIADEIAVTI